MATSNECPQDTPNRKPFVTLEMSVYVLWGSGKIDCSEFMQSEKTLESLLVTVRWLLEKMEAGGNVPGGHIL